MVSEEVRNKLSINDCIAFQTECGNRPGLIIDDSPDAVEVLVFKEVTSELHQQYCLRPVVAEEYPMAYCGNMIELMGNVSDKLTIPRTSIIDIIFIVPIREVESSLFHIAGSKNAYFIRYYIKADNGLCDYHARFYFNQYIVEPFSHRIFYSFNLIAHNLKRSMHHLKETDVSNKTFRVSMSMESFLYLSSKLPSAVQVYTMCKEASVIYYNNLSMEARTCSITKYYVRVLHMQSMLELRKVLGSTIGLGICSARPTKKTRYRYCTINGTMNSVEMHQEVSGEIVDKPLKRTGCNGIDFVYKLESRQLVCTVRFTKLIVSTAEIATSRVPIADVKAPRSSAYVGAWFIHDGVVLEVVKIVNDIVACKTPDNDEDIIELPLPLVSDLVNRFGRQ
jgi:hypothetical protein